MQHTRLAVDDLMDGHVLSSIVLEHFGHVTSSEPDQVVVLDHIDHRIIVGERHDRVVGRWLYVGQ